MTIDMMRCAFLFFPLLLSACAGQGPYWGEEAAVTPGWKPVGRAALTAASDPFTWAPGLLAAGLQIGDADDEIAEWANEKTPLFGSRKTAEDGSDWLRGASLGVYGLTGLLAPVPGKDRWKIKVKGFAVGGAAILATGGATSLLKDATSRTRPLGQDDESLPSGHTSAATINARLARQALGYYDLSPGARLAGDIGLAGMALTTGWARVEAGQHHPADILAGMALGNFLAVFTTEAFLKPATDGRTTLSIRPQRGGMALRFAFEL